MGFREGRAIFPLLFAIGATLTPWDKLLAAIAVANMTTSMATTSRSSRQHYVMNRLAKEGMTMTCNNAHIRHSEIGFAPDIAKA